MACSKQLTLLPSSELLCNKSGVKTTFFSNREFSFNKTTIFHFSAQQLERGREGKKKQHFFKATCGENRFSYAVHPAKTLKYFLIVSFHLTFFSFFFSLFFLYSFSCAERDFLSVPFFFAFLYVITLTHDYVVATNKGEIFSSRFHNSSMTRKRTSRTFHFPHFFLCWLSFPHCFLRGIESFFEKSLGKCFSSSSLRFHVENGQN